MSDSQKLPVEVHPAADLFPMMAADEYAELVDDIRVNGQRVPITYWGGKLLDGRNRYKACQELGIEPDEEELDEDLVPDPVAWVLSTNLHRRHLTASQRAMVAGRMASMTRGGDRKSVEFKGQKCPSTTEAVAEQLKVGARTVKQAKTIIRDGSKALTEAVDSGTVKVSLAEKLVRHVGDKSEQSRLVKRGTGAVREAVAKAEATELPENYIGPGSPRILRGAVRRAIGDLLSEFGRDMRPQVIAELKAEIADVEARMTPKDRDE